MDLVTHLTKSLWILELEHAFERFPIRTYLDWLDLIDVVMNDKFPERVLNCLKGKVSNPCS